MGHRAGFKLQCLATVIFMFFSFDRYIAVEWSGWMDEWMDGWTDE